MRRRIGRDWIDMGPSSARDWTMTVDDVSVCVNGHPLDGATYSNGYARCRTCHAENERRRRAGARG